MTDHVAMQSQRRILSNKSSINGSPVPNATAQGNRYNKYKNNMFTAQQQQQFSTVINAQVFNRLHQQHPIQQSQVSTQDYQYAHPYQYQQYGYQTQTQTLPQYPYNYQQYAYQAHRGGEYQQHGGKGPNFVSKNNAGRNKKQMSNVTNATNNINNTIGATVQNAAHHRNLNIKEVNTFMDIPLVINKINDSLSSIKVTDLTGFDDGNKLKCIINKIPKRATNNHHHTNNNYKNVYKLKVPLGTSTVEDKKTAFLSKIDSTYKLENKSKQPLLLGGNNNYKVNSINDYSKKFFETFLNKDKPSITTSGTPTLSKKPRQLQLRANVSSIYNESFELSFDGKAMDRSDIFRMVDSFSMACSDDENSQSMIMQNTQSQIIDDSKDDDGDNTNNDTTNDENESSFIATHSKNILPAEITSGNSYIQ